MTAIRFLSLLLLTFAAINGARVAAQQPDTATTPLPAPNSLASELERCKELNEKAASDERCEEAYKANRKLFFSHSETYQPVPVEMFPKGKTEPWTTDKKADSTPTEK